MPISINNNLQHICYISDPNSDNEILICQIFTDDVNFAGINMVSTINCQICASHNLADYLHLHVNAANPAISQVFYSAGHVLFRIQLMNCYKFK